ncbi:hypothetical protein [Vibrio taketomensis]|uniref:hypothetical protein n=1 Tax=Vibrio taketomensis TaxID=2572923 RepID=UPI00138A513A|nr:hypothetical protein [Vibrio taketomensis]
MHFSNPLLKLLVLNISNTITVGMYGCLLIKNPSHHGVLFINDGDLQRAGVKISDEQFANEFWASPPDFGPDVWFPEPDVSDIPSVHPDPKWFPDIEPLTQPFAPPKPLTNPYPKELPDSHPISALLIRQNQNMMIGWVNYQVLGLKVGFTWCVTGNAGRISRVAFTGY